MNCIPVDLNISNGSLLGMVVIATIVGCIIACFVFFRITEQDTKISGLLNIIRTLSGETQSLRAVIQNQCCAANDDCDVIHVEKNNIKCEPNINLVCVSDDEDDDDDDDDDNDDDDDDDVDDVDDDDDDSDITSDDTSTSDAININVQHDFLMSNINMLNLDNSSDNVPDISAASAEFPNLNAIDEAINEVVEINDEHDDNTKTINIAEPEPVTNTNDIIPAKKMNIQQLRKHLKTEKPDLDTSKMSKAEMLKVL